MSQIKTASLVSYTTIFLNILVGMVLTPMMIKYLGQSEYGIYMLVGSLVGYLALFDFGLSNTTVRFVSKYRHSGDIGSEREFIATNLILYILISLVIICVGLVGFFLLDNFGLQFSSVEMYTLKVMYLFMLINIILIIIGGSLLGIINAYECFCSKSIKLLGYY